MSSRRRSVVVSPWTFLVVVATLLNLMYTEVECGWKDWVGYGGGGYDHHGGGWESKGITFGIKSKGMTAIIPFPLPIPIFSKEKKKEDDGGGWEPQTKGGGGGWEPQSGGNDWWK